MKTKVKICGIRHIDSAEIAIQAGADFIGFNFVLTSKRFINPIKAKAIIDKVRKRVDTVGIFQNATLEEINEHVKFLKLDYVQLHGNEDNQFVKKIKTNVIKAFHLPLDRENMQLSQENIYQYTIHDNVDYILLDREVQGQGEIIDMQKAKEIAERFHVFLAGGLHSENVAEAVKTVKPFAVDVASGIETNGIEDMVKIQQFIQNAKGENI